MKKLIPIVLVLMVIGLGSYKYYQWKNPQEFPEIKQEEPRLPEPGTTPVTELPAKTSSNSSINIQVEAPMNGVPKGVVEVGASGFNAFVVYIDSKKNWELAYKEFGASLAYEGFATTEDVKQGLKKYISAITDRGVAGRNTHFVISSGALKNPKMNLIADAIQKMGYTVNKATADQEGKYALKAAMPAAYRNNSFVVDIGSGNTKISWYEGSSLKTLECAGAKYYQIPKTDQEVYNEISEAVKKIPENLKQNCFMIGGVPFKLAQEVRNGDDRFTKLEDPDFYSGGDDVKKKSGINIYRAIVETSKVQNCIFDWDANFTIGFLMSLN